MTSWSATIVITTYGRPQSLPGAIESALAQDFPQLEVLVAEEAALDETREVVERYLHDPPLRSVRYSNDFGRAANYRHLLENDASGDVVLNLDGNDWLIEPGFISRAMTLYARYPKMALVFARTHDYSEQLQMDVPTQVNRGLATINDGLELLLDYANGSVAIPHAAALYRRDLALQASFYLHDYRATAPISLLSLLPGHLIGFIDQPVAARRMHDANAGWKGNVAAQLSGDWHRVEVAAASVRSSGSLRESSLRRWQRRMLALSGQEFLAACCAARRFDVASSFVLRSALAHPRSTATMLARLARGGSLHHTLGALANHALSDGGNVIT